MGCIRKVHPFVIEEKKKIEREQEAIKLRVLFKSLDLFLRFTGMREREREKYNK